MEHQSLVPFIKKGRQHTEFAIKIAVIIIAK